jgi:DNA-binding IclR family transcriptional regulator
MDPNGTVPALRRGLAVLRLLASHAGPVPAAAIAAELKLPRSTVYHLLTELTNAGFVTHLPEDRRYGLGVAAFELGSAYLRHDPLERLARPLLRRLVDRVGHTAHLGVLHGPETLYLVREQPRRPQTLVTDVGVRLPAQLPASGRAMLAAPVLDHGDRPVAAISVTFRHDCPESTDCGQTWPELAAEVLRAAGELSGRIGGGKTP